MVVFSFDKDSCRKVYTDRSLLLDNCVSSREKAILGFRYCTDRDGCRTIDETACAFNISRNRVRQIEAKAIRRSVHKSAVRKRRLSEFLNAE